MTKSQYTLIYRFLRILNRVHENSLDEYRVGDDFYRIVQLVKHRADKDPLHLNQYYRHMALHQRDMRRAFGARPKKKNRQSNPRDI